MHLLYRVEGYLGSCQTSLSKDAELKLLKFQFSCFKSPCYDVTVLRKASEAATRGVL